MISIQDIKGVLATIGIILVFSYGGVYIIHKIFRKKFCAKRYSIWLFVIDCVGFTLLFYSKSVLAKCEHKKEEYRKLLCSTKKLAIYDTIMSIVLIIKYYLIN